MASRVFRGNVISTKMQKSVVVEVTDVSPHPVYRKLLRRSRKFLVHDDVGVKVGDLVTIKETRPISKTKRFKIVEVAA